MIVRLTHGGGQASRLTRSLDLVDTISFDVVGTWGGFSSAPAVACSDSGYAITWVSSSGLSVALVSNDGVVSNRVLLDAEVQVRSLAIAARADRYAIVYDGWFHSSQSQDVRAVEVAQDGAILRRTLVARAKGATPSVASSTVARGDSAYLAVFVGPYSDTSDINGRFVWPEDSSADTGVIHIRQGCRAFKPQVAFDGEYFWVAWLEETTPFAETVAKVARVTQRGVVLDTGGIFVGCEVTSVALAAAEDTALVALHLDGDDIVGMRYDSEAQLLDSTPFLITTHGGLGPLAAASADTFLVMWFEKVEGVTQGKVRLAGRRITASGKVVDPDARDYAFSASNHWNKRPAIASDGENFLAVWCDERAEPDYSARLVGKRFDNQGRFLDAETFTITDHHLNPVRPNLSYGAGCYFLCWNEVIGEVANVESTFATRITREGELMDSMPIRVSDTSGALGVAYLRDSMFVVLVKTAANNLYPYVIRAMADGRVLDSAPILIKVRYAGASHYHPSIASMGDTLVLVCGISFECEDYVAAGLYDRELRPLDSAWWKPPPGADWVHRSSVACGGGRILATSESRVHGLSPDFYLLDSALNVLNDSLPLSSPAMPLPYYSMTWDGGNFMCASPVSQDRMSGKGCRISRDGVLLDSPPVRLVEFGSGAFSTGFCRLAADSMGHVGFAFFTFETEGYMSDRIRAAVFPRLTGWVESPPSFAGLNVLQVGPNSSTGIVWLKLGASAKEPQIVTARDIAGRVRAEVSLSPASAERGRTMLDLRHLPAGVYFLETAGERRCTKLVLARPGGAP
ncbi:hypothetical protein FJY68_12815 [candidate division WOR-3 bacterium]|uniref:Uncharacterized protein n=1 Tax=candidate division WOR-3 bacterium TaxID=2052148 RepID=A0A937XJF2_UNCW3|nr:hypothetical protein [candidate division WOR-3 bacterium]